MRPYKAGMPTLIECDRLEQNVEIAKELGLSFIELNMDLPICTPERLPAATLREITEDTGLFFTAHLPEGIDLAAHHPAMRRGNLELCREIIVWAKEAGIPVLNMHLLPGIYFTLPDGKAWINERYEAGFLGALLDSFEQLYAWSREYGVTVCLENTMNFHIPFLKKGLARLSEFPEFALTWDVGHDARSGLQDRPVMLEYASRIRHLHVHDFDGKKDHLPLGTGQVNLAETLEFARRHDLSFVIETKTAAALRQSCTFELLSKIR